MTPDALMRTLANRRRVRVEYELNNALAIFCPLLYFTPPDPDRPRELRIFTEQRYLPHVQQMSRP